ncbi:hypothetical protein SVIOM74S_05262 [Streptomyces violarus]
MATRARHVPRVLRGTQEFEADMAVTARPDPVHGGFGQAVVVERRREVVRAGVRDGDEVAGLQEGNARSRASRSPAKQAGPAMSWRTGPPRLALPLRSWASIRRGQASGLNTVRVATCTPAWVTAIGRPPMLFVYSTYAAVNPFLARTDRPNSVTISYPPENSAGAWARSCRTYVSKVGVVSSSAKFTGSPPPMSMPTTWRRPSEALTSSANATACATPPAMRSSGQPCEHAAAAAGEAPGAVDRRGDAVEVDEGGQLGPARRPAVPAAPLPGGSVRAARRRGSVRSW